MDDEKKRDIPDAKDIKEFFSAISSEVPALVKSILNSVFSEEAGRNMGKAAAAYYKELKDGGLPEQIAVKMTQEYMRTFTSLGEMLKGAGKMKWSGTEDIGDEIERRVAEKIEKKRREREEEEE